LGGHTWTTQGEWAGKELISQGGKNAVVCEVGRKADYGSFKNFSDTISANTITFDPVQMKLSYNSRNAGKLTMDTNGLRLFNDQPMPLDYPTYGSPFMKSEWDSGLITIYKNGGKMVLDFRA
jgi:hypothetical protein